ncbi:hypothetical protein [Paenisporosarcina sp. NPDC076898]|uniref:hypothetical protein n=1 Tax=unclassified Paenisporosarcina TaxID=2642018 RepID=UPI003D005F0D
MKKGYIVLITLVMESFLLWLFSILLGWTFIDTIFLGGLLILGGAWFYHFNITPRNSEYDVSLENKNTQNAEAIKPFLFIMSPITWGLSIFAVGSSFITIIKYYPFY